MIIKSAAISTVEVVKVAAEPMEYATKYAWKLMYPNKGIGYRKPNTVVQMIYPNENNSQLAEIVAKYRYPKARGDLMISTFKK